MTTINDNTTHTVRKSRNLRGLYDHARRIARRDGRPLCTTVDSVEIVKLTLGSPRHTHLTVYYNGGDVGQVLFYDFGIATRWGKRFAEHRGGTFSVKE